jgi:hypothetical protein
MFLSFLEDIYNDSYNTRNGKLQQAKKTFFVKLLNQKNILKALQLSQVIQYFHCLKFDNNLENIIHSALYGFY